MKHDSPHRRLVILGPVPCRVCRRSLVWDGIGWLFAGTDLVHNALTCPGRSPDGYWQ